MSKTISAAMLLAVAVAAQNRIDDPDVRQRLVLTKAGVAIGDESALIRALQQYDDPWLAAYAAHFLGKLPKSDPATRELNAAALSDHEFLAKCAMESLMGWGDRQWVSAARVRLPNFRDQVVRLSVAGLLARAGAFDGWDMIESTVMHGPSQYRAIALLQVDSFRDMKGPSGRPVDLVKKLDSMRSNSPSKEVRDALLNKIIQLTRQVPASGPGRE